MGPVISNPQAIPGQPSQKLFGPKDSPNINSRLWIRILERLFFLATQVKKASINGFITKVH